MGNHYKKLSCGILIFNNKNEILGCHCAGRPFEFGTYDIPKGLKEDNETEFEAVYRELKEETGLSYENDDISNTMELGTFNYLKDKDLYLQSAFKYRNWSLEDLICSSTFEKDNIKISEINGYKWISQNELNWFFKSLQPTLKEAIEIHCNEWEAIEEESQNFIGSEFKYQGGPTDA